MPSQDILAVIGTAGRAPYAGRITRDLYDAMYGELLTVMSSWGVKSIVSGGAAVADHLAVRAYLAGEADRLILHFPAPFEGGRFIRPERGPDDSRTANRYHESFSGRCGIDSLAELREAISKGAEVHIGAGFKARNLDVAADATHMLAMTFGPDEMPSDLDPAHPGFSDAGAAGLVVTSGTAHTWRQCWKAGIKRHVSLTWLERTISPSQAGIRL
jgi:hypothetical protein